MKKLVVILVAVAFSAAAQEQTKFEPLYRAAKKLQSADRASLNILRFGQLLDDLTTELSVAKDRMNTDPERQTVAAFDAARGAYADFKALWLIEKKFQGIVGDSSPIPCVPDCLAIVERRELKALPDRTREVIANAADKKKAAATTKGPIYYISDVMTPVFDIADAEVAKASALYMGKKPEPLKP